MKAKALSVCFPVTRDNLTHSDLLDSGTFSYSYFEDTHFLGTFSIFLLAQYGNDDLIGGVTLTWSLIKATKAGVRQPRIIEAVEPKIDILWICRCVSQAVRALWSLKELRFVCAAITSWPSVWMSSRKAKKKQPLLCLIRLKFGAMVVWNMAWTLPGAAASTEMLWEFRRADGYRLMHRW